MIRCYLIILLCGCTLNIVPSPTATYEPTPSQNIPADVWKTVAPGIEQRAYDPVPDNTLARVIALRFDPALYSFRLHYRPGEPLRAAEWAAALPDAIAMINANFFDANNRVLGLLVTDGVAYGSTYVNQGGTFLVQNGIPRVRSNILEPYAGEALEQAAQAFPMLLANGTQAYTSDAPDRFTRRTVIAQDDRGRILLMATPFLGLPLLDLSTFLPATDMGLVNALNLDGGGSTLMLLNISGQPEYVVISLDPVPAVIAVYARS